MKFKDSLHQRHAYEDSPRARQHKRSDQPKSTPAEVALIATMRDMPLRPGQMLLLGPKSVEILTTGKFQGVLPDRFVFEREEWNAKFRSQC